MTVIEEYITPHPDVTTFLFTDQKLYMGDILVNGYFVETTVFIHQIGHGREMGKQAIDLYTEIKSVWINHA